MLKPLNTVYSSPNKFIIPSCLKKGDVVQLATIDNVDNNVYFAKSNGLSPFGVLLRKIRVIDKKTRVTKHHVGEIVFQRCLIETHNYDTNQRYPINANLYIDIEGRFSTKQSYVNSPVVGMVTGYPSAYDSSLQLVWF